jgi:hypothetical protein
MKRGLWICRKFISERFICCFIDFVTQRQREVTRLFMCHIQNIIYYLKICNGLKDSICVNFSYVDGFVLREVR